MNIDPLLGAVFEQRYREMAACLAEIASQYVPALRGADVPKALARLDREVHMRTALFEALQTGELTAACDDYTLFDQLTIYFNCSVSKPM